MNLAQIRNRINSCFDEGKRILKHNIVYFVLLCVCLVVGVVIGLFFVRDGVNYIFVYGFSEDYFLIIFDRSVSVFGIFVQRLLGGIGLFLLAFFCGLTLWCLPVHFLFAFYRGYVLGCVLSAVAFQYGVAGVAILILTVAPVSFLATLALLCAFTACTNNLFSERGCGFFPLAKKNAKGVLICFFAYLAICLLEVLLILLIVRPLNTLF